MMDFEDQMGRTDYEKEQSDATYLQVLFQIF